MPEQTLILDGDSVCFISCYNADKDTLPLDMFICEGERNTEVTILAKEYVEEYVESILEATGCDKVEIYLTTGRENFRYTVDPAYKSNRKLSKYPTGLNQIKDHLLTLYDGELCKEYEADDICVLRAKDENTLLSAIDKDVLMQSVGTHYNYKKNEYITVTKEEAEKFLWIQMIQGDTADGIYGIEGMGIKKATAFLSSIEPTLYYNSVLDLYKSKGKSKKEFLSNLNLLDMHLLQKDGRIKLHE